MSFAQIDAKSTSTALDKEAALLADVDQLATQWALPRYVRVYDESGLLCLESLPSRRVMIHFLECSRDEKRTVRLGINVKDQDRDVVFVSGKDVVSKCVELHVQHEPTSSVAATTELDQPYISRAMEFGVLQEIERLADASLFQSRLGSDPGYRLLQSVPSGNLKVNVMQTQPGFVHISGEKNGVDVWLDNAVRNDQIYQTCVGLFNTHAAELEVIREQAAAAQPENPVTRTESILKQRKAGKTKEQRAKASYTRRRRAQK